MKIVSLGEIAKPTILICVHLRHAICGLKSEDEIA
jgi:hypothetical protein